MNAKDLLPWNWHKHGSSEDRGVEVHRRNAPAPARDLRHELNRLLDGFFEHSWGPDPFLPAGTASDGGFRPALEVTNEDDALSVVLEIPGLEEKDIDVSVDDDLLTIRGEKRSTKEETRKGVRWSECSYGAFERGIPLPPDLDLEAAKAEIRKGVLRVRIPKTESARKRTRQITVEAG